MATSITSADSRVFNTAELVEQILLQGFCSTSLHKLKRLSPFFNNVIKNSLPLGRIAFTSPTPATEIIPFTNGFSEGTFIGPLQNLVVSDIHPFVNGDRRHLIHGSEQFFLREKAYTRAHLASVASQLVCQPPCGNIRVFYKPLKPDESYYDLVNLHMDSVIVEGETIGDLMAVVEDLKRQGMWIPVLEMHGHADRLAKYGRGALSGITLRRDTWASDFMREEARMEKQALRRQRWASRVLYKARRKEKEEEEKARMEKEAKEKQAKKTKSERKAKKAQEDGQKGQGWQGCEEDQQESQEDIKESKERSSWARGDLGGERRV
jgi:hypothetical protein